MLVKDFLLRKTKAIVSTVRGALNRTVVHEQEEASDRDFISESLSVSLMRQSSPVSPAGMGSCSPG